MNETFAKWRSFCRRLDEDGRHGVTAASLLDATKTGADIPFLVLKHDVETSVKKAYRLAKIEAEYGHRCSYYVQYYLLKKKRNVRTLQKMAAMGHEVSYHYDVMDAAHGDVEKAAAFYAEAADAFRAAGFTLRTVCQHGNPGLSRTGYSSNRDFFRNAAIRASYPETADMMVNFPQEVGVPYLYFSDAGYRIRRIPDPTADLSPSVRASADVSGNAPADVSGNAPVDASGNALFADYGAVMAYRPDTSRIVSVHPHRFTRLAVTGRLRRLLFVSLRGVARRLLKRPSFARIYKFFYPLSKHI